MHSPGCAVLLVTHVVTCALPRLCCADSAVCSVSPEGVLECAGSAWLIGTRPVKPSCLTTDSFVHVRLTLPVPQVCTPSPTVSHAYALPVPQSRTHMHSRSHSLARICTHGPTCMHSRTHMHAHADANDVRLLCLRPLQSGRDRWPDHLVRGLRPARDMQPDQSAGRHLPAG